MSETVERPCGEKPSKLVRCSGTYHTTRDYIMGDGERYVGYYWNDGKTYRCKDSGCPIHEDPICEGVANRLEGK